MPSEPLTIFWTTLARGDVPALEAAVREEDATLCRIEIDALVPRVNAALGVGAVIVVCSTDKEASLALLAGVDEVVRSGEVTREALDAATVRARARASARSSRVFRRALLADDEELALGLLSAALSTELAHPLASATDEVDRLSGLLTPLLEVSDEIVAWSSKESGEAPRRIAARRLAVPTSEEVKEGVARLDDALQRARALLGGMLRLARSSDGLVSASEVVAQVTHVLRSSVVSAEITLETAGVCRCAAPRSGLVLAVTALVTHALESIRASDQKQGHVSVRVYSEEDATIIEVEDDGCEVPLDRRPDLFDPAFGDAREPRAGMEGVRDRVRRSGGDLILETGPAGTTARLIFPSELASSVPWAAPLGAENARSGRARDKE
jgi:signal transduction histidine kinase